VTPLYFDSAVENLMWTPAGDFWQTFATLSPADQQIAQGWLALDQIFHCFNPGPEPAWLTTPSAPPQMVTVTPPPVVDFPPPQTVTPDSPPPVAVVSPPPPLSPPPVAVPEPATWFMLAMGFAMVAFIASKRRMRDRRPRTRAGPSL
jgi:hypothetical protein